MDEGQRARLAANLARPSSMWRMTPSSRPSSGTSSRPTPSTPNGSSWPWPPCNAESQAANLCQQNGGLMAPVLARRSLLNEGVVPPAYGRQRRCALAERHHCPPVVIKSACGNARLVTTKRSPRSDFNAVSIPDAAPSRFPPCQQGFVPPAHGGNDVEHRQRGIIIHLW